MSMAKDMYYNTPYFAKEVYDILLKNMMNGTILYMNTMGVEGSFIRHTGEYKGFQMDIMKRFPPSNDHKAEYELAIYNLKGDILAFSNQFAYPECRTFAKEHLLHAEALYCLYPNSLIKHSICMCIKELNEKII